MLYLRFDLFSSLAWFCFSFNPTLRLFYFVNHTGSVFDIEALRGYEQRGCGFYVFLFKCILACLPIIPQIFLISSAE